MQGNKTNQESTCESHPAQGDFQILVQKPLRVRTGGPSWQGLSRLQTGLSKNEIGLSKRGKGAYAEKTWPRTHTVRADVVDFFSGGPKTARPRGKKQSGSRKGGVAGLDMWTPGGER